jgi:hypothetical protein
MPRQSGILHADRVIQDATQRSGFSDLGDQYWLPGLELLMRSLREDANLHEQGMQGMHERSVNLMAGRLRIQHYLNKYPEIREEEIRAPIFIVALARTGTTMLQRFLASDPRNYAVLWYEARNPAPLNDDFAKSDARLPLAEEEVAFMLEHYPGLGAIHPMEATGPDECIMLLEHTFCSGMPLSMANVPRYNDWEFSGDHMDAYTDYKQILQFLQWQKKRRGEHAQRWVLKAPEHLGFADTIFKLFPDATMIQSHREPEVTIPSISSMIYSGWAAYTAEPDKHLIGRYWASRFSEFIRRYMLSQQAWPKDRFINVWYKDLLDDPLEQAEKIYQHIGVELGEQAREAMSEWREANKREKRAKHEYTLEEYGFTSAGIKAQFEEYYARYIN